MYQQSTHIRWPKKCQTKHHHETTWDQLDSSGHGKKYKSVQKPNETSSRHVIDERKHNLWRMG